MNDRIEIPFIELREGLFDRSSSSRLLWRVMADVFGKTFAAQDEPAVRSTARALFRSNAVAAGALRMLDLDASKLELFPPTVAMLSGICWQQFGFEPELASVTLYADGDDFIEWHTDHDALVGPDPGHANLATFSFGARRSLEFAKIGHIDEYGMPETIAAFDIPDGSAYRMRPDVHRHFMHRVPAVLGKARTRIGARVAVTFFCGQRGAPADIWWTMVDRRVGKNPPLFAGPAREVFARMCASEDPVQLVTPLGYTVSRHEAARYLEQLGLFNDELDALLRAANARGLGGKPKTPAAETDAQTAAIVDAEHTLAAVRCSTCGGVAFGCRMSDVVHDIVADVVPEGATVRLCLGCVATIVGRPLEATDFAIDVLNRPMLQAFVAACNHNGLAERRAAALERIAAIDAANVVQE